MLLMDKGALIVDPAHAVDVGTQSHGSERRLAEQHAYVRTAN
jgi:hypothetical protein